MKIARDCERAAGSGCKYDYRGGRGQKNTQPRAGQRLRERVFTAIIQFKAGERAGTWS